MNVKIAQRLADLRRQKGYSQESLANALGLSRQAVSKWERAESSPDTDNLIALARLYGVSLDDLLNIDKDIEDDVSFEDAERTKHRAEEEKRRGREEANSQAASDAAQAAAEASRAAAQAAAAATHASRQATRERVYRVCGSAGWHEKTEGCVALIPLRHSHDSPLVRAHHLRGGTVLVSGLLHHPRIPLACEHHGCGSSARRR